MERRVGTAIGIIGVMGNQPGRATLAGANAAAGRRVGEDGVAAAEQQHALVRCGLRFAHREVEVDYRGWQVREAVPLTRAGMVASLVTWTMAAVLVYIGARDYFIVTALWVFAITMSVMAASLATTFRPSLIRWVVPSTMVANTVSGLSIVWITGVVFERLDMAMTAINIAVYFGFVIFRLRPVQASVAAVPYLAANQALLLSEFAAGGIDYTYFLIYSNAPLMAMITGCLVGLIVDRMSRQTFRQERIIEAQRAAIQREHARAEGLLLNVLPAPIASRLMDSPGTIAERFDEVTVLFVDLVDFTSLAARTTPEELVAILNDIFQRFDVLAAEHGVEKIKTIGDAYMAVAGLPTPRADHARAAAAFALDVRSALAEYSEQHDLGLRVRIGLASGPVVAGVIGASKFTYDLWGDVVNLAARMESHGLTDEIQMPGSTAALLGEHYHLTSRGAIEIKGKGPVETWLLAGPREAANLLEAKSST